MKPAICFRVTIPTRTKTGEPDSYTLEMDERECQNAVTTARRLLQAVEVRSYYFCRRAKDGAFVRLLWSDMAALGAGLYASGGIDYTAWERSAFRVETHPSPIVRLALSEEAVA